MCDGTERRMLVGGGGQVRGRERVAHGYENKERRGHTEGEPVCLEHPIVCWWSGPGSPVSVQRSLAKDDDRRSGDELDHVEHHEEWLVGVVQPRDPPHRCRECGGGRIDLERCADLREERADEGEMPISLDRKSTRLNSSHGYISYAVFCLK